LTTLPGSAPFRSPRPVEAATPAVPESISESKPIEPIRIYDRSFPVPKRFIDAVWVLFDFRFRYFITPWVIKILWGLTVAVVLICFVRIAYDLVIQPSMSAPGPRLADGEPGWEFEPLAGQSFFQSRWFLLAVQSFCLLILLLCIRVVMECSIVFFRVAGDIAELKRALPKEEISK
jgi:hypothetical protein